MDVGDDAVSGGAALGHDLGEQPQRLAHAGAVAVGGEHGQLVDDQQFVGGVVADRAVAQALGAHPRLPFGHGVAEVAEQGERVGHGGGPPVKQRGAAVGLHPAFEVDHPQPDQAGADHRAHLAQWPPQQRPLPGAGAADHQDLLALDPQQERAAEFVIAHVERGQVDLVDGGGDGGGVQGARERHPPLDHDGDHAGPGPGHRDLVGTEGVGESGGAVGEHVGVLSAHDPHGQGVDRGGGRADPHHAGHQQPAGAAVLAGQVAGVQHVAPTAPPVDGPAPPGRADPGGGPPVERGRVRPPPHQQPHHQRPDRDRDRGLPDRGESPQQ